MRYDILAYILILWPCRISGLPEKLPEVNWEHYNRVVPIPGLVERFKKEYMAMAVPFPADAKNLGKDLEAQAAKMVCSVCLTNILSSYVGYGGEDAYCLLRENENGCHQNG